jgi:wobble nucleotide-excising tRNase
MEDKITAIEERQQEIVEAIVEINNNLASVGYSTTESIKAIMEGFQSMNTAMHGIIQNFSLLEERIAALEKKTGTFPFTSN